MRRVEFKSPGHFICADRCRFFIHTHVNGRWCVSTVGDYRPVEGGGREHIGASRFFETMVFDVKRGRRTRWQSVDMLPANTRPTARRNHERLVAAFGAK